MSDDIGIAECLEALCNSNICELLFCCRLFDNQNNCPPLDCDHDCSCCCCDSGGGGGRNCCASFCDCFVPTCCNDDYFIFTGTQSTTHVKKMKEEKVMEENTFPEPEKEKEKVKGSDLGGGIITEPPGNMVFDSGSESVAQPAWMKGVEAIAY